MIIFYISVFLLRSNFVTPLFKTSRNEDGKPQLLFSEHHPLLVSIAALIRKGRIHSIVPAPGNFPLSYQHILMLKILTKYFQETRTNLTMLFCMFISITAKKPQTPGFFSNRSFSCPYRCHPHIALTHTHILLIFHSQYGNLSTELSGIHLQ